jgi:hypothetical protein
MFLPFSLYLFYFYLSFLSFFFCSFVFLFLSFRCFFHIFFFIYLFYFVTFVPFFSFVLSCFIYCFLKSERYPYTQAWCCYSWGELVPHFRKKETLHAVHRNTAATTEHAFEYSKWCIHTVYNLWNVAWTLCAQQTRLYPKQDDQCPVLSSATIGHAGVIWPVAGI